jgi:hypothetical protein
MELSTLFRQQDRLISSFQEHPWVRSLTSCLKNSLDPLTFQNMLHQLTLFIRLQPVFHVSSLSIKLLDGNNKYHYVLTLKCTYKSSCSSPVFLPKLRLEFKIDSKLIQQFERFSKDPHENRATILCLRKPNRKRTFSTSNKPIGKK